MITLLGTQVDVGPGHTVLVGDAAPPRERGTSVAPSFWPMSITVLWPRSPSQLLLSSCKYESHDYNAIPQVAS